MRHISTDVKQTEALGEALGRSLRGPAAVALCGGLGAGKTAFVRGLARGLDVTAPVTSPTFALAREYPGRLPLFHFDLYRLSSSDELFDIGWEDYLARDGVCAVEWSERAAGALPPGAIYVTLDIHPDNPDWRLITCDHPGL
jgi:tRNA threonylcarbamoyladenosine biosynthesis protein TsaE